MHPLVAKLRERIFEKIPESAIKPEHTEEGHFYRRSYGALFPSVTGKLQVLKDESLINYKANRVAEYIFANFSKMNEGNLMEHLNTAKEVAGNNMKDAGEVGTRIHSYREKYFNAWIESGVRPEHAIDFIDPADVDPRAISGMRGIEKFCIDTGYIPVVSELLVYDDEFMVAGTLDDIGLIPTVIHEGNPSCRHDFMVRMNSVTSKEMCILCGRKTLFDLVLPDLKTSNQFKDHYFFQVAMYYWMFKTLTKLKVKRAFILKVSKEDGTWKIEELRELNQLIKFAKSMIRVSEALTFIKKLRKDNQKIVGEEMEL